MPHMQKVLNILETTLGKDACLDRIKMVNEMKSIFILTRMKLIEGRQRTMPGAYHNRQTGCFSSVTLGLDSRLGWLLYPV